jgi:hypothetical protein
MCDGEMAVNGNLIPSWIDGRSNRQQEASTLARNDPGCSSE